MEVVCLILLIFDLHYTSGVTHLKLVCIVFGFWHPYIYYHFYWKCFFNILFFIRFLQLQTTHLIILLLLLNRSHFLNSLERRNWLMTSLMIYTMTVMFSWYASIWTLWILKKIVQERGLIEDSLVSWCSNNLSKI